MDVPVRLGRKRPISPANVPLVSDAAIRSTATLEGIISLLAPIDPRLEQRDVTARATGSIAQSSDVITRLEVIPSDLLRHVQYTDGGPTGRVGVKSHGHEPRAICAVANALRIRIRSPHRVRDVFRNPEFSTSQDFSATNLAVGRGGAAAAATTAAVAAALARHHFTCSGSDIPVGDVAAVGGLVPEGVAVDAFAVCLARELDFVAAVVLLDHLVASAGAGATVDAVAFDGVCADHRGGDGQD